MRLVFMGTPEIAKEALSGLLKEGHEVAAVYTRPDKPVGRKQLLTPPPVKVLAEENGLPVCQPKTLRSAEEQEKLAAFAPELIVVVAYGLLLPKEVLELPAHGCINLHVSLLPQYRGAAPVQWAVIHGESETGVSIMLLDEGLDTGPVLQQEKVAIGPEETAGELLEKVGVLGSRLLADTVQKLSRGTLTPMPQSGEASYAPQLKKEVGQMDFTHPATQLHNLVRGCNPWPLAWFVNEGKKIQVLKTHLSDLEGAPGEVLHTKPLTVGCGAGALVLAEVRPEGKNAMTGEQWRAGRRLQVGDRL